jgi:catechol 2,3-dioxygenase-like lactoylglutathione lyase family enzyme
MLKTQGVVHFTIPVKDLDRSEKFYTEIMGMERLRRNSHMVFMRAGADCFVLTYSQMPVDPNAGDAHDIHHAFRVSAKDYEDAKVFQGGGSPLRNVPGAQCLFSRSRPQRAGNHRSRARPRRRRRGVGIFKATLHGAYIPGLKSNMLQKPFR